MSRRWVTLVDLCDGFSPVAVSKISAVGPCNSGTLFQIVAQQYSEKHRLDADLNALETHGCLHFVWIVFFGSGRSKSQQMVTNCCTDLEKWQVVSMAGGRFDLGFVNR